MPEAKAGGGSLIHNVRANFLTFLAGKAAAGLAGIVLLRLLGPVLSGQYLAALGLSWLFSFVVDLGLGAYLTREVARERGRAGRHLGMVLSLQALQLVVAGLLLGLLLGFDAAGGAPRRMVVLAFGVQALTSIAGAFSWCLQGLERFSLAGLLGSLASLLNALGLLLALWLSPTPMAALWASLASGALGLLLFVGGARRAGLVPDFSSWRLAELAPFWRSSLPFALVSATNQLYVRVDLALLTWLAGAQAVGYYGAGVKTVDLLVPVLGALSGPIYARLAFLEAGGDLGQSSASLKRALRWMTAVCLPVGVGGSLLAAPLMTWLYGAEYAPSAAGFLFLAWVPALIGMHSALLHALNAAGRTKAVAGIFGFNLFLNIALNLALIPRFGFAASAAISAACEVVNLAAAAALLRGHGMDLGWRRALWPAAPACLAMGLALAWFQGPGRDLLGPLAAAALAPLLVGLGAAVYGLALGLLGFFGPDEREQLKRMFGGKP